MTRALLLGRWQPFHLGHLELVQAVVADGCEPLIAIGSAQESHSLDNPFTAGERYLLIEAALAAAKLGPFPILPLPDAKRNNIFVAHVEGLLPPFSVVYTGNGLAHRLFAEAGYNTRFFPHVRRDEWEGAAIRRAMRDGGAWEAPLQPEVAALIREIDGPARLRAVAGARYGGPSATPK